MVHRSGWRFTDSGFGRPHRGRDHQGFELTLPPPTSSPFLLGSSRSPLSPERADRHIRRAPGGKFARSVFGRLVAGETLSGVLVAFGGARGQPVIVMAPRTAPPLLYEVELAMEALKVTIATHQTSHELGSTVVGSFCSEDAERCHFAAERRTHRTQTLVKLRSYEKQEAQRYA